MYLFLENFFSIIFDIFSPLRELQYILSSKTLSTSDNHNLVTQMFGFISEIDFSVIMVFYSFTIETILNNCAGVVYTFLQCYGPRYILQEGNYIFNSNTVNLNSCLNRVKAVWDIENERFFFGMMNSLFSFIRTKIPRGLVLNIFNFYDIIFTGLGSWVALGLQVIEALEPALEIEPEEDGESPEPAVEIEPEEVVEVPEQALEPGEDVEAREPALEREPREVVEAPEQEPVVDISFEEALRAREASLAVEHPGILQAIQTLEPRRYEEILLALGRYELIGIAVPEAIQRMGTLEVVQAQELVFDPEESLQRFEAAQARGIEGYRELMRERGFGATHRFINAVVEGLRARELALDIELGEAVEEQENLGPEQNNQD